MQAKLPELSSISDMAVIYSQNIFIIQPLHGSTKAMGANVA